jgi:DNA-binding transcriptional ArsR family regulator
MRLSKETILEILTASADGETPGTIAKRFGVDPSTVRHHIEVFENTYGSVDHVYTVIRSVQRICTHPSLKCLVCGQAHDHIHRRELEDIALLTTKLDIAREVLKRYGYELE